MPSATTPDGSREAALAGLRIVCFESRRSAESSRLIARYGGEPIEAPSLREVPLLGPEGLGELEADLLVGHSLLVVLLTGVGTELLIEGLAGTRSRDDVRALLSRPSTQIVCRGPKPHAILKQLAVRPAVVVGEPNTWRDVLCEVDRLDLGPACRIYVQEYGRQNDELVRGLAARGSEVRRVRTYEWKLPEDLAPLASAIERIATGDAEVALFTSGIQLTHLRLVAERLGLTEALTTGLRRCVIASVGPLTTEALVRAGLPPDIEPEHPKLGHLIVALAQSAREKLEQKRASERAS